MKSGMLGMGFCLLQSELRLAKIILIPSVQKNHTKQIILLHMYI